MTEEEASRRDAVNRKADHLDLHRLAEQKADVGHVREALQHKADRTTVDALKATQAVSSDLAGRIALIKDEMKGKACVKVPSLHYRGAVTILTDLRPVSHWETSSMH